MKAAIRRASQARLRSSQRRRPIAGLAAHSVRQLFLSRTGRPSERPNCRGLCRGWAVKAAIRRASRARLRSSQRRRPIAGLAAYSDRQLFLSRTGRPSAADAGLSSACTRTVEDYIRDWAVRARNTDRDAGKRVPGQNGLLRVCLSCSSCPRLIPASSAAKRCNRGTISPNMARSD